MSIRALFIRHELEKLALFAIHKKFYFTTGRRKEKIIMLLLIVVHNTVEPL